MAACSQFLICVFISVSQVKTMLIAAKNTHFWFFGKVYFRVFIQHVTDIWHNLKSARVCYNTTFPSRERGLSGDFCPCIQRRCSHGLKNRHEKSSRSLFNLKYVVRKYETGISDKQFHAFALNVAFQVDRTVCSSSAAILAFSIKRLFVKHNTYLFNKSYLKGGLKCLWKDKTFLLSSEISSGNLFFPNIYLYSQVLKKSESRQSFSGKLSKVNKPR